MLVIQAVAKDRINWRWGGGLIAALPYAVTIVTTMIHLAGRNQPILHAFTLHTSVTTLLQLIVALFICYRLSLSDDLTEWLTIGTLGLLAVVFVIPFMTLPLIGF